MAGPARERASDKTGHANRNGRYAHAVGRATTLQSIVSAMPQKANKPKGAHPGTGRNARSAPNLAKSIKASWPRSSNGPAKDPNFGLACCNRLQYIKLESQSCCRAVRHLPGSSITRHARHGKTLRSDDSVAPTQRSPYVTAIFIVAIDCKEIAKWLKLRWTDRT